MTFFALLGWFIAGASFGAAIGAFATFENMDSYYNPEGGK